MFHFFALAQYIEATFGSKFLAAFRYQAHVSWRELFGNTDHFVGHRQFQIHVCPHGLENLLKIMILYVPAVLTKVDGNAVGTRLLRHNGGFERTRIRRTAHLPQRCHVINIDAKMKWVGFHVGILTPMHLE
jgi:hypothetical protein